MPTEKDDEKTATTSEVTTWKERQETVNEEEREKRGEIAAKINEIVIEEEDGLDVLSSLNSLLSETTEDVSQEEAEERDRDEQSREKMLQKRLRCMEREMKEKDERIGALMMKVETYKMENERLSAKLAEMSAWTAARGGDSTAYTDGRSSSSGYLRSNDRGMDGDARAMRANSGGGGQKTNHRATNPSLYKTELCRQFSMSGSCSYGYKCQFAHGEQELQKRHRRHPKYKTQKCKAYWNQGFCPYGSRCQFLHEIEERDRMTSDGCIPTSSSSPLSVPPTRPASLRTDASQRMARWNDPLPFTLGGQPSATNMASVTADVERLTFGMSMNTPRPFV